MKRIATMILAATGLTPFLVSNAMAQEEVYERDGVRDGLTFGVALGGGDLGCSGEGCENFEGSGSFDFHIGGMMNPSLAMLFDGWWMVHDSDDLSVNQGILTASVRAWPVNHFWLQGGLGVARAGYTYNGTFADVSDHSEWVPAFQVGIGVEPIATEQFGLDIGLRYGTGFYSNGDDRIHNLALTVGASFY